MECSSFLPWSVRVLHHGVFEFSTMECLSFPPWSVCVHHHINELRLISCSCGCICADVGTDVYFVRRCFKSSLKRGGNPKVGI